MGSSNSPDPTANARTRLERSYLFVPADRPERIAKAFGAQPDAVIVDLEDAVAPAAKDAARAALAAHLQPQRPVVVRINGVDTPWFDADVELCRQPGVLAVMLPKAEQAETIQALAAGLGVERPILPLIETAKGLWNALEIARCTGVWRLAFGPVDFQLDLGVDGDDALAAYRSQLVLACRVAGSRAPLDGPSTAIEDIAAVRSESARARRMGFGGKLCIHPRQVAIVNECFSPSAAEVAWAERVVAAVQSAAGAAVAVDGKMVDKPVLSRAEAILREHRLLLTTSS